MLQNKNTPKALLLKWEKQEKGISEFGSILQNVSNLTLLELQNWYLAFNKKIRNKRGNKLFSLIELRNETVKFIMKEIMQNEESKVV